MLIRDVMTTPATTIGADTTIREAVALLDQHKITILPVVGPADELIGIVSEADLLAQATTDESDGAARYAGEVMTRMVTWVAVDADLDEVIELMATTLIKSFPVLDHGRVVGVISRSDVIHMLAHRDQRLRAEVVDLLYSESPDWYVEVADGVVTVTGPADEHERRLATVLAGSVTGVQGVRVR
jgi:CBS domain-containing protein